MERVEKEKEKRLKNTEKAKGNIKECAKRRRRRKGERHC